MLLPVLDKTIMEKCLLELGVGFRENALKLVNC